MQSTVFQSRPMDMDPEMFMNLNISGNFSSDTFQLVNASLYPLSCLNVLQGVLTAFVFTDVLLLLPLYTSILFLGFQQWKKQRSTTTRMSHSDVFTCHMVAIEMIGVLMCVIYCVGIYIAHLEMIIYSIQLFTTTWCVKIQFHMLTCVELYLAVVHPVTYLQLKDSTGVRIRNISVGCVWLLSLLICIIGSYCNSYQFFVVYLCLVAFALIVISCCCIAVLWTLRRPAPGDGNKQRVDKSKQRAFNTISTIMAVLLLCLSGIVVCNTLGHSLLIDLNDRCLLAACVVWVTLPSSLVLPLLFLHRTGRMPCWKH